MQNKLYQLKEILQNISTPNLSSRLGLYIHTPFCQSKCDYCDFYSIPELKFEESYVQAVTYEIENFAKSFKKFSKQLSVDTIFFGGGTPSVLSNNSISKIVNSLKKNYNILPNCEWSIEINPGTVNLEKFKFLKNCGFNRISIGVQSFKNEELNFLGRIHSAIEAEQCIKMANGAGFKNISLDLMCAFPGQSISSFEYSLKKAVSLPISHLSCYTLIPEKGTPLYKKYENKEIEFYPDNVELQFYNFADNFLECNSFNKYEISNYYKENFSPCLHNLKYWNLQPYIGFGPAAHSYISPYRWGNVKNVILYNNNVIQDKDYLQFSEKLTINEEIFEYIFLHLRMNEGIEFSKFNIKFHKDFFQSYKKTIESLLNSNLAQIDKSRFFLTDKGLALAEEIALKF